MMTINVKEETRVILYECSQEALDSFGSLSRMRVGGFLSFYGCTKLKKLPDGLRVRGGLQITWCVGLTRLPDGLIVAGGLNLGHCIGLTSLPQDLQVGDIILHDQGTGFYGHENEPGVIPEMLKDKLSIAWLSWIS